MAELRLRSVLTVGMFPFVGRRSLSVYSTEPRGLAAADPDGILILASFSATALGDNLAVHTDELRGMTLGGLFPSGRAMTCAAEFLMNRRHLSASKSYDILRRASAELVLARHGRG